VARQNLPQRLQENEAKLRKLLGHKEFELIYRSHGQGDVPSDPSGGAKGPLEAEILVRLCLKRAPWRAALLSFVANCVASNCPNGFVANLFSCRADGRYRGFH